VLAFLGGCSSHKNIRNNFPAVIEAPAHQALIMLFGTALLLRKNVPTANQFDEFCDENGKEVLVSQFTVVTNE
jgi:hypothetical protein